MGLGRRLDALEEASYVAALADLRAVWEAYDWEVAAEFEDYFDTLPPDESARTDACAAALERLLSGGALPRAVVDTEAATLAGAVDLPPAAPALLVLARWTEELKKPPTWARR